MASEKTLITLLGRTEGRDKMLKFLAAFMRVVFTFTNAKQHAQMASQVSETRTILRLALWINNIRKIQLMFRTGQLRHATDYILVFRILGDMMYCVHDNVAYAAKYGLVLSKAHMPGLVHRGFVGMFWGFFSAVILDLHALATMNPNKVENYHQAWKDRVLLLTRNVCDMLAALHNVGYVASHFSLTPRTLGLLGMVSGSISTYENWNKAK